MQGVSKESLGAEVIKGIAKAKTDLKKGTLRTHQGLSLINPQMGKRGATLFEADVDQPQASGRSAGRGSKRLVLLVQSGRITEMYFSENHYRAGSWSRILDF